MPQADDFLPYDFRGELTPTTFKRFLKHCADGGASDILIQGGDFAWVEIHGRQRQASTHTVQQGHLPALIASVWSAEVEMGIRGGKGADRSLEVSGAEAGLGRGQYLRFRCNFIQGRVARLDTAYAITMRLIPSELPQIEKMGIEKDLFQAMYPAMGLGVICGPTGSGKTTLQAGVYNHAGTVMPDRKVITYEDPVEFVLGGPHWLGPQPHQAQVGRDIDTFALGLRNAMRRKPSIIGIGEMRDLETIDAALEAGLSGHLTYGTMHTESCAETISRAIQVYPAQQQSAVASRLIGCLRFIVVQRLLKTTDGRRAAVREFVVFDRHLRNELQGLPYEQWSLHIRSLLEARRETIDDKAWELYKAGQVEADEFIALAGLPEFEKRSTKQP